MSNETEYWSKGVLEYWVLKRITPVFQHSSTLSPSLDGFDGDHVRCPRLLERQPGGDGDQVAPFDEP